MYILLRIIQHTLNLEGKTSLIHSQLVVTAYSSKVGDGGEGEVFKNNGGLKLLGYFKRQCIKQIKSS